MACESDPEVCPMRRITADPSWAEFMGPAMGMGARVSSRGAGAECCVS